MVEAIRDALIEEMYRDGSVVVLGEDVALKGGVFRATEGLLDRFGPCGCWTPRSPRQPSPALPLARRWWAYDP